MALTALQERVAGLVRSLPEAEGFVLAGGAAMSAHHMLDRATRDLDYFGRPDDLIAVARLADAFEALCRAEGLGCRRLRDVEAFVRFHLTDGEDACELDLGVDYRALEPVQTRYGPTLELRELGANKVLAIFSRAEPRDFVDLAELVKRFPLSELIDLAIEKDPGLDLAVFHDFMNRVRVLPRIDFPLDDTGYQELIKTVAGWQNQVRELLGRQQDREREGPGRGMDWGMSQ